MILATATGWALERFVPLPNATMIGLLLGMLIAQLVPKEGSCTKPRDGM